MICLMTIKVDRKDLNEKDNYNLDATNDDSILPVSASDESIIEFLLEIIKSENTNNE